MPPIRRVKKKDRVGTGALEDKQLQEKSALNSTDNDNALNTENVSKTANSNTTATSPSTFKKDPTPANSSYESLLGTGNTSPGGDSTGSKGSKSLNHHGSKSSLQTQATVATVDGVGSEERKMGSKESANSSATSTSLSVTRTGTPNVENMTIGTNNGISATCFSLTDKNLTAFTSSLKNDDKSNTSETQPQRTGSREKLIANTDPVPSSSSSNPGTTRRRIFASEVSRANTNKLHSSDMIAIDNDSSTQISGSGHCPAQLAGTSGSANNMNFPAQSAPSYHYRPSSREKKIVSTRNSGGASNAPPILSPSPLNAINSSGSMFSNNILYNSNGFEALDNNGNNPSPDKVSPSARESVRRQMLPHAFRISTGSMSGNPSPSPANARARARARAEEEAQIGEYLQRNSVIPIVSTPDKADLFPNATVLTLPNADIKETEEIVADLKRQFLTDNEEDSGDDTGNDDKNENSDIKNQKTKKKTSTDKKTPVKVPSRRNSKNGKNSNEPAPVLKNVARWCSDIDKEFSFDKKLLPSRQMGITVVQATRKLDNLSVVVKIRNKKTSFQDDFEKNAWLVHTEQLKSAQSIQGSTSICKILDLIETEKRYFVIMERARGIDLFAHMFERNEDGELFDDLEKKKKEKLDVNDKDYTNTLFSTQSSPPQKLASPGPKLFRSNSSSSELDDDDKLKENGYNKNVTVDRVKAAQQIAFEVLLALEDLHKEGIVHRDVKLENIVLHEPTPFDDTPFDESFSGEINDNSGNDDNYVEFSLKGGSNSSGSASSGNDASCEEKNNDNSSKKSNADFPKAEKQEDNDMNSSTVMEQINASRSSSKEKEDGNSNEKSDSSDSKANDSNADKLGPLLSVKTHASTTSGSKSSKHLSRTGTNGSLRQPQTPIAANVKMVDFDTVISRKHGHSVPAIDTVVGTDQYIAPEAYLGCYTPASDIFGLGVMIYKIITEEFPFRDSIFDDQPGENVAGSPKMRQINTRLKFAVKRVDFRPSIFSGNLDALDFVKSCLNYAPNLRPTCEAARKHKWIVQYENEYGEGYEILRKGRGSKNTFRADIGDSTSPAKSNFSSPVHLSNSALRRRHSDPNGAGTNQPYSSVSSSSSKEAMYSSKMKMAPYPFRQRSTESESGPPMLTASSYMSRSSDEAAARECVYTVREVLEEAGEEL